MNEGALRETLDLGHSLPRLDSSFAPRRTRAAAKEIAQKLGDGQLGATPTGYDLDSLHRRVWAAWQSGRGVLDLSPVDLRMLPWVLCYPPAGDPNRHRAGVTPWLAENQQLLHEYGEWLSNGGRTRAVRTLLHVFLRDYPVRLDSFEYLRSMLKTEVLRRRKTSLSEWALRCHKYALVKENGSGSFVGWTIGTGTPVGELLKAAGLVGPLERSAFLRQGLLNYLSTGDGVANLVRASAPTGLERLLALLECEGSLRFREPRTRQAIAQGLLSPFLDSAPKPTVKEVLQRFFLRCFGDPRLPSGRQNWSAAREDLRRVVIRWLNEQSLELFFRVVEETALDKHWRYRKSFWQTCFDGDLIDDVWFVLGNGAQHYLRRLEGDEDVAETTGSLTGATYGQSVLLMQMASGVTIAEWSHNGACRIWLGGNPAAPQMYEPAYTRSDVFHGQDHRQVHSGSDVGRWQNAIADWLYENTGLWIDRGGFPQRRRSGARRPWSDW